MVGRKGQVKNDNNTVGYKGLFGATDMASLKNLMSVSNGIKANDHTANLVGTNLTPSFMINLTTDGNEISCNNDSCGGIVGSMSGCFFKLLTRLQSGVEEKLEVSLEEYLKYHISSILKMTESSKVEGVCRWSY